MKNRFSGLSGVLGALAVYSTSLFSGCALPTVAASRNAGQGYLGNFERTVPPDDGKEYSAGEIPHGWRIYERRSTNPGGNVDEKMRIYIENEMLYVVGVSDLWKVYGSEQSAIRDAEKRAALTYARTVHGLDGEASFEGDVSGLFPEANELVVVKNDKGEVSLIAEVRCSIPLKSLPSNARNRIEERYGGR